MKLIPAVAVVVALAASISNLHADTVSTVEVKSDLEREKRLASEIEDVILDGEPIYLKSGDHPFLAIDLEPGGEVRGAVIVLHNRGQHPDWEDAIYPLRTGLAEAGWRTLALQMPVLGKDAQYYDYVPVFSESHPRIEAGIAYLREQGIEKIVLAAHSCGAHMSMSWIAKNGDSGISAYVGMGMGATDYQQFMAKPFPLDKMTVPVLDVYGSLEYAGVLSKAKARKPILAAHKHGKSAQIELEDANHYFTDAGEPLVKAVSEWLAALE